MSIIFSHGLLFDWSPHHEPVTLNEIAALKMKLLFKKNNILDFEFKVC